MSTTIALSSLFGKEFNIPHYQRGYRWGEQEVTELLDDLWNFQITSNKGEFYCLQPIVVQKIAENSYNVLDGQQRLTSLYLILVYLEDRRAEDGYTQSLFTLNYETRKDCETFLEGKRFIGVRDETNIDYYHICNAYNCIDQWFRLHPGSKGKMIPVLMDNNDKGNRNVRFIWYEVEEGVNPIEVFIRLNVGKIPLTDAELIKALLFQSDKYGPEELESVKLKLFKIASEWDAIEYALQNDEFWFFLNNNTNNRPTHIEFIFDLIASDINRRENYEIELGAKHSTFLIISKYLQSRITNEDLRMSEVRYIWEKVSSLFEYLKSWYDDRRLYHYIGFLISHDRIVISTLVNEAKNLSKPLFEEYLKSEIADTIKITKQRNDVNGVSYTVLLNDLSYDYENNGRQANDQSEIKKLLLLHNVFSTLNGSKEKARFPFDLYKKTKKNENWSLEHIQAQNSESITNRENQITWLNDHLTSLEKLQTPDSLMIVIRLQELLNIAGFQNAEFDKVVEEVNAYYNKNSEINDINNHCLGNLCLIDKNTNSQLNNSVFDVKREKIRIRELEGHYIPISTRNIFLKSYTSYPRNNAYWSAEDRRKYLESISNTYNYFINPNNI